MVKKAKKDKKISQPEQIDKQSSILESLEKPRYIFVFFIFLFVILAIHYKPMVFDGLEPGGSDAVSGIARTHQLQEWEQKTGKYPLWNPYMFGGMPTYHRLAPVIWSLDTILEKLDFLLDWRIWYFLAGALGLFLLIKFWGLPAAAAMLTATAFVLMPHFQALVLVGHFAKFRALMWMPYVLLTFLFLTRKQTILSMLLFSLALALQLRTQHYQIIFYTLVLILFTGIPQLYTMIRKQHWKPLFRLAALSTASVVIAILVVAQNLFSIREYTPYSTRGGYAISIQDTKASVQDQKGVGFDYATNWSYSVSEWWNLIIPKFHGGTSNEVYKGDAVPQWKNQELPTYWGTMPFTQSYEYMGIIIIFLAVIGIIFQWHKWEVKSITFLTLLALILSLGKNFDILYKLFFYYVPYFDKFRAPVMILTLVMFSFSVLAAFGLSFLLQADLRQKEVLKRLYILFGIFTVVLIIPLAFGSTFSLTHVGETQRYNQTIIENLKKVRLEMLINSSLLSLIFLAGAIIGIFGIIRNWFRREYVWGILFGIIILDFMILNLPYLKGKFINPASAEQQYRANDIDREIQKDNSLYRVFPFGPLFSDVHWVYHHQSIGGYSPAKLQVIQEIADNCLYQHIEGKYPINWNVLNMLNTKYLIMNQQVNSSRLTMVAALPDQNLFAYEVKESLPRAYFVENYQVISDGIERLKFLNSPDFQPARTAILEKKPAGEISNPDSSTLTITNFTPELITLDVFTDKTALLVLSEIMYPPGWRAVLDESTDLEIYKTNHLLRSVVVPAGTHTLKFYFEPKSYYAGLRVSLISLVAIYVLVLLSLLIQYRPALEAILKNRKS
ncbi:MAG: hypothetical protein JSW33_03935 [bacterium]|nr:MAG: hypothetical protein JSW33_03935 [bacterium]